MKHVIVVKDGHTVIKGYSNLKKLWNKIDIPWKQGYSTVALTLSLSRPYDVGACVVDGREYENLVIQKIDVL